MFLKLNPLNFVFFFSCLSLSTEFAQAKIASDDPVFAWCTNLSQELKSVKHDRCLSQPWKVLAKSQEERVIPYFEWKSDSSKKEKDSSPKKVLILGGIHGDELSAVSMVFRWIDFLENSKSDSFLRENHYAFVPLVNPDGFFAKPRTRTNKSGVDLNRNFETQEWKEKAIQYWKSKAGGDVRRFPGKGPSSEVETKAIQKVIEDFSPDIIISVHAPYKLVDHDGPIDFPDLRSPLPVRTLGAYPGSLGTYAGIERKIPVVTPELPNAKQLPDLKSVEDLFMFIMKAKY